MKKLSKGFLRKLSLLAVAASACTVAGISTVANGEETTGLTAPLAENVKIGQVIEVPDYYYESVKATANIVTPSGTVISGSKFTVDEGGKYVIEYVVDNTVVHSEDCVAVMSASDMFSVNALASVEGISDYAFEPNAGFSGVAINVKAGASVTFNREIDVTGFTKNDVFFEATVEPSEAEEADFAQMILTVTDPEDASSYFRLAITDGNYDGGSPKCVVFLNGAANGQTSGGYNYGKNPPYFQFKDIYGTDILSSFRASRMNGYSQHSIKLYYDVEENAIYAQYAEGQRLVVDFNDPVIFGGNVWDGFESGKAVLSVSFAEVKDIGGKVIFNQIGGISLQNEEIVDDVAPAITVDLGGESKAPNALIGTKYNIFPCTATDFFDNNVQVITSVTYKNVFGGAVSDVLVKDNAFTTDRLGTYTIRYVAVDYSGNQAVKEISFECIAKADDIVLTRLPADFTAQAFDSVSVPTIEEVRAFGGNGTLDITVKVLDPDGQEVPLNDFVFVPQKLGVHQVVYTATDYYGASASSVVKVEVTPCEKTLFNGNIILPKVLIAGFKYTLPQVTAKACYQDEIIDCNIQYLVNGQELSNARTFEAVAGENDVICRAVAADGTVCDELSTTVVAVDGQSGKDQTAYFYNEDGKMTVEETMTTVDLIAKEDSTVEFINSLNGSGFALGVNYLMENVYFGSFNVTLSDAENENVSVTFKFQISNQGVKLTVPFGQATDFTSADGYFKLNFDSESGIVSDANVASMAVVDKDDAGNDFVGFGNNVYAKWTFKDVYKESKISLSVLNNQSLGFRTENEEDIGDVKGPEIIFLGDMPVRVSLGSKFTLYPAKAYDVLSQTSEPTITVQSPSGKLIVPETAADREFVIDANEVGSYRVIYQAYDSLGNRTREGQLINVYDSVAPTMEVTFSDVTKKVGDTITLPSVTAADDSGKVYYDIFLSLPNSEMRMLWHSANGVTTSYLKADDKNYPASFKVSENTFKLEMKGKYVLTVMAYDDNYNVTMQSFTITVK